MKRYLFTLTLLLLPAISPVEAAELNSGWTSVRDPESGQIIWSMEMTLHPAHEAQPALKYRFIPDEFDQKEGNAAVYYLRAMGFMEQNYARDQLSQVWKNAREQADQQGTGIDQLPPYIWLDTPPKDLPLEEVKKYLTLTSFQPRDLVVARQLKEFDMHRNVREADNPIMTLLPEVQNLRELARNQSLRCRVAVAEGRFEDAIDVLGQQFALAHHLSQDPFLVSNLVGAAIEGIAFTDALHVLQMPEASNLYWAFAALPRPLVSIRKSMAFERQLLFLEMKALSEVDEQPRPAEYWRDFIDRVSVQLKPLAADIDLQLTDDPAANRLIFATRIAAAYPAAKRYLVDEIGMNPELVDSYTSAQAVFLAQRRLYEIARDEMHKWLFLDLAEVTRNAKFQKLGNYLHALQEKYGWIAAPSSALLPATQAVLHAMERTNLHIAMLQTVEALRMYTAENEGQLPQELSQLSLPAPADPFTGNPIAYTIDGGTATLTGVAQTITYKLLVKSSK